MVERRYHGERRDMRYVVISHLENLQCTFCMLLLTILMSEKAPEGGLHISKTVGGILWILLVSVLKTLVSN